MYQEIYTISDNEELNGKLKEVFSEENEYLFKNIISNTIEEEIKNIPDIIIIDEDNLKRNTIDVCKMIRSYNDNTITPIIVISSNVDKGHRLEILKSSVEYFIEKPFDEQYLYYTIKNLIRLMQTNRRISPLTGLPGNVQIQIELKKRLLRKRNFAVLYLDLDNFKEYNDIYGFIKGDEVIKYTARNVLKIIHQYNLEETFVGHIGGDDFVAIVSQTDYEKLCQDILINFENGIEKYFSKEDIERGYLEVANRKGIIEQFPLTALSIGVVTVEPGEYQNILEIGEIGAQVKHIAKTQIGNSYAINRRKK